MIAKLTISDTEEILRIAREAIGFEEDEIKILTKSIEDFLNNQSKDSYWIVYKQDNKIVGGAYYRLEPMTDRTWNLLFLAVDPQYHNQGIGSQLVNYVEDQLKDSEKGRVLIVETLDTPEFSIARKFYSSKGFQKYATIPNYYYNKGSKVIFGKELDSKTILQN